jgi:hypothetical protein
LEKGYLDYMGVLQQHLEQTLEQLPSMALQQILGRKLKQHGINPTQNLTAKLAAHILSGNEGPYTHKSRKLNGNLNITLDETDMEEITKIILYFREEGIQKLIPDTARQISKIVFKNLKSRWPTEEAAQNVDLIAFRQRLEARWSEPLSRFRMLTTMVREWAEEVFRREQKKRSHENKQLREILNRMLARACQVTDEIVCLLENGFADGAMARWRTLHEIAVVATIIADHGESIAERYLAHQAIESYRAMKKFENCCVQLGYKPLTAKQTRKITDAYRNAITRYGNSFDSDYGWAALHLKNPRPTFVHLEAEAGRAHMRSHYQMGNENVHAGVKSMFIRLGLLGHDTSLLSGRSNGGLMEPGQNAAHTLTQLAVLICLAEPNLDDLVIANMICDLRNEIPSAFCQADKHLRRDDKHFRANARKHSLMK